MTQAQRRARLIALALPALLLAGAWAFQLVGGLPPCEMCHWQRWPHYGALLLAVLAYVVPQRGSQLALVAGAAVLIALSGALGVYHAGVEYHWWQGHSACTATPGVAGQSTDALLRDLLAAPLVRCDAAQWQLFGVSLAGFNALFSLVGAAVIGALLRRRA